MPGRHYVEVLTADSKIEVGTGVDVATLTSGPDGANLDKALQLGGGFGASGIQTAVDIVLDHTQYQVYIDASGAPRSAFLPPSVGLPNGRSYLIQKTDATANAVAIVPNGADTINGAGVLTISAQFRAAIVAWIASAGEWKAIPISAGGGAGSSNSTLSLGAGSLASSVTTRYLFPRYYDSLAQPVPAQLVAPFTGTLRNLYIRHNVTAGNGNPIVYTVRINGVATAITVSLASTSLQGSDLVNTVAVVAGDRIDIEVTKAASIAGSPLDVTATFNLQAP